jgi:hypothetical protein
MPVTSKVRRLGSDMVQIQCNMLAMIAICASQPAVNANVRAAGMPAA